MKAFVLLWTMALVGACAPSNPATQSNLQAGTCLALETQPDPRFSNAKECFYAACNAGDKESCDYAASYNGNMQQDSITAE